MEIFLDICSIMNNNSFYLDLQRALVRMTAFRVFNKEYVYITTHTPFASAIRIFSLPIATFIAMLRKPVQFIYIMLLTMSAIQMERVYANLISIARQTVCFVNLIGIINRSVMFFCLENTTCSGLGLCDDNTGKCDCNHLRVGSNCQECLQNYYGEDCLTYCFAPSSCHGGGTCGHEGQCVCDDAHTGQECELCVDGRYSPPLCREILRKPFRAMDIAYFSIGSFFVAILIVVTIILIRMRTLMRQKQEQLSSGRQYTRLPTLNTN